MAESTPVSLASFVIATVLTLLSMLLQIAGFVTPGWQMKTEGNMTEAINLWYVHVCEDGSCHMETLEQHGNSGPMVAPRVEATIALIACFIVCILKMTMLLCSQPLQLNISANMAICFLSFISGVLPLVTAGRQTSMMLHGLSQDPAYVLSFPYSLLLVGIGGILSLVLCCLYMARICSLYNYNNANYQSMQAECKRLQAKVEDEPPVQRQTSHQRTFEFSLFPFPQIKYAEHDAVL